MSWAEASMWNGILVVMETIVLTLCTWFFQNHTEQNVDGKRKYRLSAAFLYWAGLTGIELSMQNNRYLIVILLVYMVFMTAATGRWLYNHSSMYGFYYFLFALTLVVAQIFVFYIVFAYISSKWGIWVFDYASANMALIIKQFTEILLTGVWVVLLNRRKYENVKGIRFAGLFLPPAVSVFIIFSLIYIGDVFMQLSGPALIILDILFLVLMNLYIWYLFSYQSKNEKLKAELELWKKQSEMQYQYYEKVEQNYRSSRKMIHDIRNHLQAIEALQEQDAAQGKEYVRNMHQMLDSLGSVNYTDNRMLNIILNDKAEEAEKSEIEMVIRIGEIHLEHVRDMDITTIFANLLDNALEAAEQAEGKRMIQVRADTFHDFVAVKIRNSMKCADTATAGETGEDADYQESWNVEAWNQKKGKGRKLHMGIGLENVRHTLEKYGGGMMTEAAGDEFTVSITIPGKGDA